MRKLLLTSLTALAACSGAPKTSTTATAPAAPAAAAPTPAPAPAALLSPETAGELAPATFKVRFETTRGAFVVEVTRSWAAMGADRFYNLVKRGYYDDVAFFRVLPGFMAQTGIHGSPEVNAKWRAARIPDDIREKSNTRGRVTFATGGPDTRTTQIFFNYADNSRLDGMGFSPFGEVVEGMETLDALFGGYGEGFPGGAGPNQGRIQSEGNAYLRSDFPNLDYIKSARLL